MARSSSCSTGSIWGHGAPGGVRRRRRHAERRGWARRPARLAHGSCLPLLAALFGALPGGGLLARRGFPGAAFFRLGPGSGLFLRGGLLRGGLLLCGGFLRRGLGL